MATKTPERTLVLTTTDTLPQSFMPVALLTATGTVRGINHLRETPAAMAEASASLSAQAAALGADAVIGIRVNFYQTSGLLLTGTAVKFS